MTHYCNAVCNGIVRNSFHTVWVEGIAQRDDSSYAADPVDIPPFFQALLGPKRAFIYGRVY